jgi:DNA-binding PadR family transcriptional regulator
MASVSATRLLVLGVVRMHGRAHGYQVRRELISWSADRWANVAPGSIYHALRSLTKQGLLAEIATEDGAGGPERTLYELRPDGETEFLRLLARGLGDPGERPEMLNAAITFMTTMPRAQLRGLLASHLAQVRGLIASLHDTVEATEQMGTPAHVAELFRLSVLQLQARESWLVGLLERLERGEYRTADERSAFGLPPAADPAVRSADRLPG